MKESSEFNLLPKLASIVLYLSSSPMVSPCISIRAMILGYPRDKSSITRVLPNIPSSSDLKATLIETLEESIELVFLISSITDSVESYPSLMYDSCNEFKTGASSV